MPHKNKVSEVGEEKIENSKRLPENVKNSPNSIEEWEEMQVRTDFDALDTRKRPDYKISYKQDVKTEDVFLQVMMSDILCLYYK